MSGQIFSNSVNKYICKNLRRQKDKIRTKRQIGPDYDGWLSIRRSQFYFQRTE